MQLPQNNPYIQNPSPIYIQVQSPPQSPITGNVIQTFTPIYPIVLTSYPQNYTTPSYIPPPINPPKMWSTGLCDCCEDCGVCLCGLLFPCCLFGKNVSKFNNENCLTNCLCFLLCCAPLQHYQFRQRLREKYNLVEEPCTDCTISFCCIYCALCQEAREIKKKNCGPLSQFMN